MTHAQLLIDGQSSCSPYVQHYLSPEDKMFVCTHIESHVCSLVLRVLICDYSHPLVIDDSHSCYLF